MELSSDYLREQIIKMAGLVEAVIKVATDHDTSFEEIFKIEDQINSYHTSIDDACFKYIALRQPHAIDLRIALSVMKINAELERMGDQAVSIKRYCGHIKQKHHDLNNMAELVKRMVKRAIDSFVHTNTKLATEVITNDQEINEINREIIEKFLNRMKSNEITFEEGFSVIRIAKNFERIGDLSTNIGEAVIFLVSGADIRHRPDIKKNIAEGATGEDILKKVDE